MMTEKLHDLIWKEDGFEVRLRCENTFDYQEYSLIRELLLEKTLLWKSSGSVPAPDVVALMGLVDTLAVDSKFYDKETAVKVEDARIEIQQILTSLLD